jgi:hypothetical protein
MQSTSKETSGLVNYEAFTWVTETIIHHNTLGFVKYTDHCLCGQKIVFQGNTYRAQCISFLYK